MRPDLRHVLMKRIKEDKNYDNRSDYADYAEDMARGGRRDMRDMRDMEDFGDMEDQRRGVRGSGRRRRDRADYMDDEDEYEKPLRLSRKTKMQWLRSLVNKDGKTGPKFNMEDVMSVATKMRFSYEDYSESDVYLMTNVLYSDFCNSFKSLMQPEKEIYHWVSAAKDFLEDDDANLTGSDKIVSYYYNIVRG